MCTAFSSSSTVWRNTFSMPILVKGEQHYFSLFPSLLLKWVLAIYCAQYVQHNTSSFCFFVFFFPPGLTCWDIRMTIFHTIFPPSFWIVFCEDFLLHIANMWCIFLSIFDAFFFSFQCLLRYHDEKPRGNSKRGVSLAL